mmetsp:Transcript_8819/g.19235  ORF Transcript_8819/g.19235 Transcript_8819/m.19235 type:complete len:219 (+) Transcript_8819:1172-1828(+)
MPSPLILPISKWKATSTSSLLRHRVTPSEPALSIGLTMALKGLGHSLRKASTTAHSEAKTCLTALSPALRTVSPMTYLFLRASESAVPLVRSPIASDSWSANSTPVSAPAKTCTTSKPKRFSTLAISLARSFWKGSTAAKERVRPAGTRLCKFSMCSSCSLYRATTSYPWDDRSAASTAPVENGSVMTTAGRRASMSTACAEGSTTNMPSISICSMLG